MDETEELRHIAREAYLFLFPLVLMDITRRVSTSLPAGVRPGFGPENDFQHMTEFPPGVFREVVRPNYDTLYSTAWLDLTNGPCEISVPDTTDRYYLLPLLDMWTDVFAVIGSRTTGSSAGRYVVVPPGWSGALPEHSVPVNAPTDVVWIIGRTQTNGSADYDAVHQIQSGFQITAPPRGDATAGREDSVDDTVDLTTAPLDQLTSLTGREFFSYGARLMKSHTPHVVDQPVLARMRRLGLTAGTPLDFEGLSARTQEALEEAPKLGLRVMRDFLPRANPVINGWSTARGNIGVYGTNYLFRAVIAMIGLGANLPEDAVYPVLLTDDSGKQPVGDTLSTLHFDVDALPPVDAFWSLTMYDGEGFPVPNKLERYALGDRDPLRFNADGSLDIYMGHDSPGRDREANWLPAPNGPIGLTLRLYAPRAEVLDGTWNPPPLRST